MIEVSEFSAKGKQYKTILSRSSLQNKEIERRVAAVLDNVRTKGDKALFHYMKLFDRVTVTPKNIRVSEREFNAGIKLVPATYTQAVKKALANLTKFHNAQKPKNLSVPYPNGVVLGYRYVPIDSVCVNAPCEQAPLPSCAMMNLVPAKLAGVKDIFLISTPKQGKINEGILYIAKVLGITNVYRISGAQGMAAMAYGTESVPKVNKIVGPGGMYTQTAKKLLQGVVGIDSFAGPSEIVVVWDDDTPARFVAADLLSQIEHGTGYEMCILFCDSKKKADLVNSEVAALIDEFHLPKERMKALKKYSRIFVCRSSADIVDAVNSIAPEHVEILATKANYYQNNIRNVGSMFIGAYSPEVVGDYFCGTNHVLPTMGTARFASGLGMKDFVRSHSIINYTKEALQRNLRSITELAEYEGMSAHSLSAKVRCL